MGVQFKFINSYFEYGDGYDFQNYSHQVQDLAAQVITPVLEQAEVEDLSHLIIATTCPDSIAPSLGQEINQRFYPAFSECHVVDIVQGCAGGVTAMLLGTQMSMLHGGSSLVVSADAARKACSEKSENFKIFGNGSFACLATPCDNDQGLIHYKSRQIRDLVNVVNVPMGHDMDQIITGEARVRNDPRRYLGLMMDNKLALKLINEAKTFYEDFLEEAGVSPDIMILHQVNPRIVRYLEKIFDYENLEFINTSELTGNCGAATVGIALDIIKDRIGGKKVFICSYGTGGVMTAGLWQY